MEITSGPDKERSAAPENTISWPHTLGIFLFALALRAIFLIQWAHLPYIDSFSADAWAHERWALEILGGKIIRHCAFYQSPFYPYFLAAFYKLFGHQPHLVFWLQAVMDAASCALISLIAGRCFGTRAGAAAGLLAAAYRPFIFSVGLLTKETFVVFGTALFTWLTLQADEKRRKLDYFLCGLAAGWTVLSRSNMLLLVPAAIFWFWLRSHRNKGLRGFLTGSALPLILGVLLPILPVTVHNYIASRDLVPVNYTGGFTFFIGNNPEAAGFANFPLDINSDPFLEESQSVAVAEKLSGRRLKPSEASAFWFRKGLKFIADEPLRWLGLTALKFWLFWNWYEIPDNYDVQFIAKHFKSVLSLPLVSFAVVGALGAAGLFFCRLREISGVPPLFLWIYLASLLPFAMSDRYRFPALVFLLPLAGAAADRLARAAAGREWKLLFRPFIYTWPLVLLCLSRPAFDLNFNEAAGWARLTTVYAERGEHEKAITAFDRALTMEPGSIDDSAVVSAAASLQTLERPSRALELYESWLKVYPRSAMLYNNAGILLLKRNRMPEGINMLERSVELDPAPKSQYKNLFYGYSKLGNKALALKYGELARAAYPDDAALGQDMDKIKKQIRQ